MNGCTICGQLNLDEEACYNCKASQECVNCCGCEQEGESK